MDPEEVLALFQQEAERLSKRYTRKQDRIQLLAQLVADSSDWLSQESLTAFIHIGGTLYKENAAWVQARQEVTLIVKTKRNE